MTAPVLIPLQQSDRYAATLRLLGRHARWLVVPGGPPVLCLRRRLGPVTAHYLPRADLSDARSQVLTRLPASAARLVVPEDGPLPRGGLWPILTPQHIAELNLPRAPVHDRLMSQMDVKWRNRLRRGLDGSLKVRESFLDPRRHARLLELELAQRQKRGYRSYPLDFLRAWCEANPKHATLFEALLKGHTVAYMLFLSHGTVATYVAGWTGPEGRKTHAHNRLMWEAMRGFFARGILRLDLGTVDTEGGASLARFKLGAGARVRTLGPTLLAPPGFRVSP